MRRSLICRGLLGFNTCKRRGRSRPEQREKVGRVVDLGGPWFTECGTWGQQSLDGVVLNQGEMAGSLPPHPAQSLDRGCPSQHSSLQLRASLEQPTMCHLDFLLLGIQSFLEGELGSAAPHPPCCKLVQRIITHRGKGRTDVMVIRRRGP